MEPGVPTQLALRRCVRECLGDGRHPHVDPWGKEFDDGYEPARAARAGELICGPYRVVLDGIQGDADFIAHTFQLTRRSAALNNFKVA